MAYIYKQNIGKFKLFNNKHNSFKVSNYKLFKNYNEIQNVSTLKPPSALIFVAWFNPVVHTLNEVCIIYV